MTSAMADSRTAKTVSKGEKPRLGWIDAVKGLTISLVVMEHTTWGVMATMSERPEIFGDLSDFAKPFRMPLFFLVAGLFAWKAINGPWRDFLDRKLLHFGYFYLLWSVIQIGIKIAVPTGGNWTVTWIDMALIPIQPFAVLWFIYELAIFFTVLRVFRKLNPAWLFAAAIGLYFAQISTGWMLIDEFAWRFIWFVSGVYGASRVFELATWARENKAQALGFAALLYATVATVVFSGLIEIRGLELLMGYAGGIGSIMAVAVLAELGLAGVLSYIGHRSLYVFVAFFAPMAAMRVGLVKFAGWENGDLITLVTFVVAVAGPIVGYEVLKRTPLSFLFVRPAMFRLKNEPARPDKEAAIPANA